MKPLFFKTPASLRTWFEENYLKETELLLGFYKRDSGKASVTWPESVSEALCFGWIDGVRRSLGEECYVIRFTSRKKGSIWSVVNIAKAEELLKAGLMKPEGKEAFERRSEKKSGIYSFEQKEIHLEPGREKLFRSNKKAWAFFKSEATSYKKAAIWWVISAKQEKTREKRLLTLISDSAEGRRLRHLTWSPAKTKN